MADLREPLPVAAPADLVCDLVADLPRMGEWSPECERVTWRGDATCAAQGSQFLGHNKAGSVRWMTHGEVVTAGRGHRLAFEITFCPLKIARSEYVIPSEADISTCADIEEWTDQRPGRFRGPAEPTLGSRRKTNQRGMLETLANLRRAAETATSQQTQPGS